MNNKITVWDNYFKKKIIVKQEALNNLESLEKRYQNKVKLVQNSLQEWKESIQELKNKGCKAHCNHDSKWSMYIWEDGGIETKWVNEPNNPLNLDIGNKIYKLDKKYFELLNVKMIFYIAFKKSLEMYIDKLTGSENCVTKEIGEKQLCIEINDRKYWYYLFQDNGFQQWKKLSFPEYDCKYFKINERRK
jgi:hypothetical protein